MKRSDLKSARTKTKSEIEKEVNVLLAEIVKVGVELKLGKHKNVRAAKFLRRNLAQLKTLLQEKTILREKEIGEEGERP